ncbi:hypothetical protein DWW10_05710 [Bacteroides intestinalis]|jgi:hypothetical protein|uniref:Uncharacterized protein n=2 Tax=Bacteroides intestinalis TaxID=329854 RepID=A0A412YG68_9BACE|nr:hypothetical protein DWW10_05710 [Bacteroides intestinalis]RHA59399.1 hypothetical protein DW932_13805 [Bacteroides intestinalis]
MSRVAGYFLILNDRRYFSFQGNMHYKFAEPVPEFAHPRHVPLVCFITNKSGAITHIGHGKRGVRAGTDLRRLNIEDIFELKKPVSAIEIANTTGSRVRAHLINKINSGGLFSPRCFEEFLSVFLRKAPDTIPLLDKYSKSRQLRISRLSKNAKKSLAEQKEAVLTAMNIAGIDKDNAQGWDYDEAEKPISFLDGIAQVRLREDSMIINDLSNIPGFDLIKSTKYSSSVFENSKTRLTVLLANRLPLEELLGTDLIYFNEDFKCFIMVQYKAMEKEGDKFVFRLPNLQFAEEISRMDSIIQSLRSTSGNGFINDYRFNENPFFVKLCPRLEFDPDNVGLSTGMYIPLDYIKVLENETCIEGERGGKAISYDNVGRYLDNTGFKTIIEGGWIGTNQNQSLYIERIIKDILENGKTAVLAIKKKLEKDFPSEQFEENEDESGDFENLPF